MELRSYLTVLRKWAWLILLVTSLGTLVGYLYSRTVIPTYQAETSLLVGQQQDNQVTTNELPVPGNLASAYAQLVTQPPILQATAQATQWPETWQTLYFHVSAVPTGGQLITIRVTDSDQVRARRIADELAHQLILQSPVSAQQQQAEKQRNFITGRLEQIAARVDRAQKALDDLTNQATLETDGEKVASLETRINTLQETIDKSEQTYAALSAQLNTNSTNYLTTLAPAQESPTPISPNIPRNILLGALAGLILAGGLVFLFEYLDDTIKNPDDVQRVLELSTLGAITQITNIHKPGENLITARDQRSPIAEAYRILRTNLRFSGIENPSGALLITSATPGEGKSTTAANLAVTLAQAGKRVVLVDADLRRPTLHTFFGLSNEVGLSNLFLDEAAHLDEVMRTLEVKGLRLITSGPPPPNPAEILESRLMNEIIADLRDQSDLVIFDSPPALAVADASILGSKCSGAVLVVHAGRTRSEAAYRVLENLKQTNVKVVGVVLNKLSPKKTGSYYYNYYHYYSTQDGKKTHGNGRHDRVNGKQAGASEKASKANDTRKV